MTTQWARRLEDHEVWAALDDLLSANDEAAETVVEVEGTEEYPWGSDWHAHTQRIVEHVRARLRAPDPEFVSPHVAGQVHAAASKAASQLSTFANNPGDRSPLSNARQPIDNLLVHVAPLAPLRIEEEAEQVRTAVESVRGEVRRVADHGQRELDDLDERLGELRTRHGEELQEAERRRAEAEDAHTTDMQARDSRLQQARKELDDINAGIAETKAALDRAEQDAREEWSEKAEEVLTEIRRLRDEATTLVSDKAAEVVSGGHMDVALDQRKQADRWRVATIVAAGLGVVAAVVALAIGGPTDSVADGLRSLGASAGLFGIAGYAGRQSHNHRFRERTSYKAALELAALEGFLANLDADQRDRVKAVFAEHFFSQPLEEPQDDAREEPITMKQLLSLLEAAVRR